MASDLLPGIGNGLPDTRRRGTAGNVVDIEHSLQAQAGVEILIKRWIRLA